MGKDVITPEAAGTIPGLFLERVKRTPDAVALRQFDEKTGEWRQNTWREVYKIVACWQSAVENEGLKPGERAAIMARNSMEWAFFDLATLAAGLVVVPIYLKESHANVVHIMRDSGARLLIIEDVDSWNALAPIHGELKNLVRVLVVKPFKGAQKSGLVRYIDDWICHEDLEVAPSEELTPQSPATVVYTSGTTGPPKGVLLSHRNIVWDAWAGIQHFDVLTEDMFLSFLPLTHMFERTAGYYIPMMTGATICYARSVKTIAEDMLSQHPTILITVPLVLQRVYEKVMGQLQKGPSFKKAVFQFVMGVGKRRFLHRQGRGAWSPLLLLWPLLFLLVGKKVLDGMGGRIRTVVSGGAPLAADIWKMFVYLGLPIIQGYGLTETSPVISVNKIEDNTEGSVGTLLPEVKARIEPTGELLVKGPMVMSGYWNNPSATAAVIDKEGWFHTGDVGEFRGGRLFITGRLKQIIVMSNGEKVPPEGVEEAVRSLPLFENVMVFGEKKPYLILVASVNKALTDDFARQKGLPGAGINDPNLQAALIQATNEKLAGFPAYAKMRKLLLTTETWSPDNGLTTNTLKVRRKEVVERYSAEIEKLYAQNNVG
ncbi:MAG: long-chain fatty acid--CoA ligase [Nitrospinae bacterium]|nr:long-chain fatty acid--CoA ligase [Nitrospinota bacterium]